MNILKSKKMMHRTAFKMDKHFRKLQRKKKNQQQQRQQKCDEKNNMTEIEKIKYSLYVLLILPEME